MLQRVLEPEVMDSDEDAREYDAMDHAAVNVQFVADLLTAVGWVESHETHQDLIRILDLGAGTAQIPIELGRRAPRVHVTAVDAAVSMVALAHQNVSAANLAARIKLACADAKNLPLEKASFDAVISNSIVHHIAEPRDVIAEAVRLTAPGGLLFHRDLARPQDEAQLEHLVATYVIDATPYQRKLFGDSLRAALTLDEIRALVVEFGFPQETAQMTSDRHWTWAATK